VGESLAQSRARVVIIGGGFGGLYAARALKDAPVQVTLLDRRNYHLFQPLLYQVATAGLSPADIASPIRAITRSQPNLRVLLAEATRIDLDAREVHFDDTRLPYDHLIIATGAENFYFGNDQWETLAPGLKSLEDALEMRRRVFFAYEEAERTQDAALRRELLTFVVVGGGPTGVELAGALAEIARKTLVREFDSIDPRDTRIYLLEGGPRILPAFPERLSRRAERDLERLGVEVLTNTMVTGIEPGRVQLKEGEIATRTVLWSAGVRASSLVKSLGVELDRGGRVIVEPDLTIPGHPEVAVVGDVAACPDGKGGFLPGLAPVATQQGECAAANIVRAARGEPRQPFVYRDRGVMATIGRNRAVAVIGGRRFTGFIAWVAWVVVHVYMLISYRNRIFVMAQLVWSYVTQQRAARLITAEFHQVVQEKHNPDAEALESYTKLRP
jgi:NADH:ubiquinone reductase (H+-translocating)